MNAFNVVRFRVKPGMQEQFVEKHRAMPYNPKGLRRVNLIRTGERDFCFVGEWDRMDSIVAARAEMIRDLDQLRDMLEDLGSGLGVTDPVSGEVVLEILPQ